MLNGLKTPISDLVWNRQNIHNATYAQAVEMVEECEKIVEIKKITRDKDLTSAVTKLSLESQKNFENIDNLEKVIKQLATTSVTQPMAEDM